MSDNGNGSNFHVDVGKATVVAVVGLLFGIGGSVLYVGASLRQIEVNSARITEIETHGTGILQTLRLQVQGHENELGNIKRDFRPRDFWESLERRLSALEEHTKLCRCQLKPDTGDDISKYHSADEHPKQP